MAGDACPRRYNREQGHTRHLGPAGSRRLGPAPAISSWQRPYLRRRGEIVMNLIVRDVCGLAARQATLSSFQDLMGEFPLVRCVRPTHHGRPHPMSHLAKDVAAVVAEAKGEQIKSDQSD